MSRFKLFLFLVLQFLAIDLWSQQFRYYMLSYSAEYFSDTVESPIESILSPASLVRRNKLKIPVSLSDMPLKKSVLSALTQQGLEIVGSSKWMKAVLVRIPDSVLVSNYPFYGKPQVSYLGKSTYTKKSESHDVNELIRALENRVSPESARDPQKGVYGLSYLQNDMINLIPLHQQGYEGKGIRIAVLDAGFSNLPSNLYFTHFYGQRHLLFSKDIVDPSSTVYDDNEHGTCVLSCMASYMPTGIKGTARNADYILLRTEDANAELPVEEFFWLMGAEMADSAGADLIQSSLGYNSFDESKLSHRFKELDGHTTLIAKAAQLAVQKGILVINSAGNEGDGDWRKIVTPADVNEVITVGGVDNTGFPAAFSSVGPTADKRVKPDVVALGERVYVVSDKGVLFPGNGTSYAAPLISGGMACLMQAVPSLAPAVYADALRLSSSLYFNPDKFSGYGIPDFQLALRILNGDSTIRNPDAILGLHKLSDGKLHVTVRLSSPQKILVQAINGEGNIIWSDKVNYKYSGVYRFALKPSKKWRGPMQIKVTFKDGSSYKIQTSNETKSNP